MSTKLKGLDTGSCIISGHHAIVGEMTYEMGRIEFFSEDNFICAKGNVNGCDFKIRGLQSEINSIIGKVRPYPGSGPVEVGHTYMNSVGEIAKAIFASEHYIVSIFDDGREFACQVSNFGKHFEPIFDEKSMSNLAEDLHHYRGRVPDSLIDECLKLVKDFK